MLPADGNWNNTIYLSNIPVKMFENTQNEDYPLHWHTTVEIIMPLKKGYDVTVRDHAYHLKENDILIVPSRELHRISIPPDARGGKRFILLFEPSILYTIFGQSSMVSKLYNITYITPKTTSAIHQQISLLLMDSYRELTNGDTARFTAAYHHIIEMFLVLVRYYTSIQKYPGNDEPTTRQEYISRLDVVFEYIDRHLTEEITMKKAAHIANFSEFHFARIFKSYANMPFHQYLLWKRVNKSKDFLQNPKISITDAAMASGFTSLTTFNRVFKQFENYTPSEYKKMYRFG